MITQLQSIISQHHLILQPRDPVIVTVKDTMEGFALAEHILYQLCDKKTTLYLSGGRTPKQFYSTLSKEEKLDTGAVGLIDERYGEKMHEHSNERMIRESGLLGYLEYRKIPFYPILQSPHRHPGVPLSGTIGSQVDSIPSSQKDNLSIEQTTQQYDEKVRVLSQSFTKSIGILGIGLDGHTAGIAGNRNDFKNPLFTKEQKDLFVGYFTDEKGMFGSRITQTFLGLSMLDILLVLVFGEDKKQALEEMFEVGSEEKIPSRFFKRSDIAQKTLLITDQRV